MDVILPILTEELLAWHCTKYLNLMVGLQYIEMNGIFNIYRQKLRPCKIHNIEDYFVEMYFVCCYLLTENKRLIKKYSTKSIILQSYYIYQIIKTYTYT